ncbi:hypothetical protein E0W80_04365 [Microbacterium sp. PI-1]|uniref:hypothetical protein n=1 Tax=Microbacterium sp. PI-1 TaxID=2545631 RepID=UPI00103F9914|nr:hypothetical protein [Microbacterium sp. PI-1]TCJ28739.1 hypothetical protein E0W80_04365 [Microbacterium sp. PI-1]
MEIDWLWPLLVGSGLTYGFTSLEGLRSRKHQDRRDAREQLSEALDLATTISAELAGSQARNRFGNDAVDPNSPAFTQLAAIEEKLPDPEVRKAVKLTGYILNIAQAAEQLGVWQDEAGHVQRGAVGRLRSILGASVRGERKIPVKDLEWLIDRRREAQAAIEEALSS